MRITNSMITNSTMKNVSRSKTHVSDAENMLSSEKKITRPSDDPIVAIKALSLRASLSEINMYLKTNIPAAEAWMDVTEGAIDNMDGILSDVYKYCNQGASDEFTVTDRSAIIDALKQYKDAFYSQANTDYAGRYCFSGFRTDSSFTFLDDTIAAGKKYSITQTFTREDMMTMDVMKRPVDITNISDIPANQTPEADEIHKLRLAYAACSKDNAGKVNVDGTNYATEVVSYDEFQALVENGTFKSTTGTFYYIYDTGDLAMTADMADVVNTAKEISFDYEKDGFTKGDVKPEMYFDCKDITDSANEIEYKQTVEGQIISYTINFGQSIQVNTLGRDTLSYDFGRDIDDMCSALNSVLDIENKIAKLKEMKDSSLYTEPEKEKISSMLDAAQKEHDYAVNSMEKLFSKEMTRVKKYQQTVVLQLSDLGARKTRVNLAKSRLTDQYTTFDDLKSKNEDAELEDTVIQYSSAKALYQAALSAASDCVKQSLLDYI